MDINIALENFKGTLFVLIQDYFRTRKFVSDILDTITLRFSVRSFDEGVVEDYIRHNIHLRRLKGLMYFVTKGILDVRRIDFKIDNEYTENHIIDKFMNRPLDVIISDVQYIQESMQHFVHNAESILINNEYDRGQLLNVRPTLFELFIDDETRKDASSSLKAPRDILLSIHQLLEAYENTKK